MMKKLIILFSILVFVVSLSGQTKRKQTIKDTRISEFSVEPKATFADSVTVGGVFTNYSTSSARPIIFLRNVNDDSYASAIYFIKDSDSPATNDNLGNFLFFGKNDAAEDVVYSMWNILTDVSTDGSESSLVEFYLMHDGALESFFKMDGDVLGPGRISTNTGSENIDIHINDDLGISLVLDASSGVWTYYNYVHFIAGLLVDDSLKVGDNDFLGLGSGKGRFVFKDVASDTIYTKDANLDVELNLSATTYGSDGSITDAEFLFINTLSSNAQDQITARLIAVDFGDSLVNYDGDGLKITNNDAIDVLTDVHGGLEIVDDSLNVKDDGVTDAMIDWGSGADQVNSTDVPDHNGHSVFDTFTHIINRGKTDTLTITLTGGLGISWTVCEIYDEENNLFVSTTAGSGNLTDNSVNYLKWISGSTLTLGTVSTDTSDVLISSFSVYDGVINGYRSTYELDKSLSNTRRGLRALFPTRIISGLSVSEDTDATNPLDFKMDTGVLWKDGIEKKTPIEILTRNTALVRHFHTGGVWDYDTNAEMETANYDNGTALVSIPSNKWVKSLFIHMNAKLGWVYPTEYFTTSAQAIAAALPTVPPGLEPIPKLTALVYQQGASDFSTAVWQDVRAGISEESFNTVSDHGALAGLADDDHPQYELELDNSAGLAAALNDETGTGLAVFSDSPSFTTLLRLAGEGTFMYLDYGSVGAEDHDTGFYFGDDGNNTAEYFIWDDGDDRFKISNFLYVEGPLYSARTDNSKVTLENTGTPYLWTFSNASGAFSITDETAGKTRLRINQGGAIGIGTTSQETYFDIHPAKTDTIFSVWNDADGQRLSSADSLGILVLGDGKVGIGKHDPAEQLDVDGNALVSGSLGLTGSRVVKGWFTDIESTNYGSDGTVSDAELLYINSLSSNAQTQIDSKLNKADSTGTGSASYATRTALVDTAIAIRIVSGSHNHDGTYLKVIDYGDSLTNYDGDGLKITNNDAIDLLLDYDGGLEIGDDSLNVKLNGATLTKSVAGLKVTDSTFEPVLTKSNLTATGPISVNNSPQIIGASVADISIADAAADGSTKGAASFTATDFDASAGNISIDYTNGQEATSGQDGFLSQTDWTTFNSKSDDFDQIVTVAKSGANFTTIQAAINDISDASTSKRYGVLIYPGEYSENIDGKDYVSLIGVGEVKVISTSDTAYVAPATYSKLENIHFELTSSTTNEVVVWIPSGTHIIKNCILSYQSTTADIRGWVIRAKDSDVLVDNSDLVYNSTGSGAGDLAVYAVFLEGTGSFKINASTLDMDISDVDDVISGISSGAASTITCDISDCEIDITITNGSYSNETTVFYFRGLASCFINNNVVALQTAGDGTGNAYYLGITAGAKVNSAYNRMSVDGFTTNRFAYANAGDTLISSFDSYDGVSLSGGAGHLTASMLSFNETPTSDSLVTDVLSTSHIWAKASQLLRISDDGNTSYIELVDGADMNFACQGTYYFYQVFTPVIQLQSGNQSAGIGTIKFSGPNAAAELTEYAQIVGWMIDDTDGSEKGGLKFTFKDGGGNTMVTQLDNQGSWLFSNSLPRDDAHGSSFTIKAKVGEELVKHDLVYMKSDEKFWKADADAAITSLGVALAAEAISADATGTLLKYGYYRDDDWNWTVGGKLYLSTTAGEFTQTPPSGSGDQVQVLGYAVSADIIFFNPSYECTEYQLDTLSKDIALRYPDTDLSENVQLTFPVDVTIVKIYASTDVGTVTIQFDERVKTTPNTGGTDVMTAQLVCDDDSQETTSFDNASIAAEAILNLDIDAIASAPTMLRIHIHYTEDN